MLGLLHFFLRRAPAVPAGAGFKPPSTLSRSAILLVQEALAKGTVRLLAHAGGWRRERHLRGDKVVQGRLWERTAPRDLGLTFSGETLRFLIWVTAVDRKRPTSLAWKPDLAKLTLGDRALLYFAYAALRADNTHRVLGLPSHPAFASHGLCRLAFPDDFANVAIDDPPDFGPWTAGAGACVLEALQPELAVRWRELERGKATIASFARMRSLGHSQELVLTRMLEALEAANRRDLARFLLETAMRVLPAGATADWWVGGLQAPTGARLADRTETYRAATAFLRSLERLAGWTDQARRVGFLDEGYAASQLWLADWERHEGSACLARARQVIQHLDPLRSQEGPS